MKPTAASPASRASQTYFNGSRDINIPGLGQCSLSEIWVLDRIFKNQIDRTPQYFLQSFFQIEVGRGKIRDYGKGDQEINVAGKRIERFRRSRTKKSQGAHPILSTQLRNFVHTQLDKNGHDPIVPCKFRPTGYSAQASHSAIRDVHAQRQAARFIGRA